MAPRLPKILRFARKLAAGEPTAAASGAAARNLALERYAARHPQCYVTRHSSKIEISVPPLPLMTPTPSQASNARSIGPYEPVTKVVFEAEEKDMESDEALWALYERWCKHFRMQHDHEEMARRFDRFRYSVYLVHQVNNSDLPYKLEINNFADGRLTEYLDSKAKMAKRIAAWHEAQKEMRQVGSPEEEWNKEVEGLSITTVS